MTQVPPPPPPPSAPAPGPVDPRSAVSGPATALMVVAVLYVLYAFYLIVAMIFNLGFGSMTGQLGWVSGALATVINVFVVLLHFLFAGVIFYGASQMKSLKNYNLAMAASVVAMLPCGYCCCVGLAVGIWSLVILMKPEVKAAFTAGPTGFPTV